MENTNNINNINSTKGIAVIGLGFIGLPLALSYAIRGVRVVGIDVLPDLIDEINQGVTHHLERYNDLSIRDILNEQLTAKRFHATTDYLEASKLVDTYIVTVGIPVNNSIPNYDYIDGACTSIAKVLKKGDTVIIRSTVIPGTTEERIAPLLENHSGLTAGEDFYLAYASERIAEGRAFEEFENMPLALGGINQASGEHARAILTIVTKADVTISNIKTVETAKVIENIQRDVNIAMVQQFASFANSFGIDTVELIKVANTHKRVNLLTPGPGVGGYCLPNAYYYIEPKANELGVSLELLSLARNINDNVPNKIIERIEQTFRPQALDTKMQSIEPLAGKKVAVLGLAMKDFSNDDRISPPIDIVKLLQEKGARVFAYDPAVVTNYDFKYDNLQDCVENADALLLLTMQDEFTNLKWNELIKLMNDNVTIFDAKNRISMTDLQQTQASDNSKQVKLLKI
jgi:UDP-N-acetyl-D-mannosaminuronic acid dehydrogenase